MPLPVLGGPEPIVVDGVGPGNPRENAFVQLLGAVGLREGAATASLKIVPMRLTTEFIQDSVHGMFGMRF